LAQKITSKIADQLSKKEAKRYGSLGWKGSLRMKKIRSYAPDAEWHCHMTESSCKKRNFAAELVQLEQQTQKESHLVNTIPRKQKRKFVRRLKKMGEKIY